jgi:hypothetical protein
MKKSSSHSHQWRGYGEIGITYWNQCQRNASLRKINFDLTIEYAWDVFIQQNRLCALSGGPLTMPHNHDGKQIGTASLDRIDSTKGYEINNVQWIHKDYQQMKWALSQIDFIEKCKTVVAYARKCA